MNIVFVGGLIIFIASIGGWLFVRRRKTDEKQIKIVFFVFYFWLLVFLQLLLFGLAYYLMTKSGVNLLK
ncbi:MAG: hypothetical protein ACU85E_11055 [Gammaproteobacteria bacterium]